MRINFRQVEIFWAVMTSGSVTKAAALLNTSQPTVSRELSRFEHVLGIELFTRVQGRLQPTAQSLTLFEEVKNSYVGLDRIGRLAEAIKTFKGGQISVACLPAFSQGVLPSACAEFMQHYPDVNIMVSSQESPLLEESLTAQRYDLGLIEGTGCPAGTRSQVVYTGDVVCVLPRSHPLAGRAVITPQDLQGERMVSLSSADPYRILLEAILAREGGGHRSVIETASAAAVCFFVQQGVGIGVVNPLTALSFSGLDIAVRRFSVSIPFSICLVTPSFRPQSATASAFSQVLTRTAGELAAKVGTLLRQVLALARSLAATPRAAIYGRIGTCIEQVVTLCSWLSDVIDVLAGYLDEEGDAMFPKAAAFAANTRGKPGTGRGVVSGRHRPRVSGAAEVVGELPITCLQMNCS